MRPSDVHLRLLRKDIAPYAVSAEGAIGFVLKTRKQGGLGPLLATTILLITVTGCAGIGMSQPIYLLGAALGLWPLIHLLRTGLQSGEIARALDDLAHLRRPLSAALIDRVLLLGTTGTPVDEWCAVPVTEDQETAIRNLALPSAVVVRDSRDD